MESYQGVFQEIQPDRSLEEAFGSDDDFQSIAADNQDQATRSVKPISFTWKAPMNLAPVPSAFESYHAKPQCEKKRQEATKNGFDPNAGKWRELEPKKVPSDIADKYGSLAVKPKKKLDKKPPAFPAWRAPNDEYRPPKQYAPPPPLTNAWEQKSGKQLFEPVSRSSSLSSGEMEELREAMRNSLSTLEDDAERRRRYYIRMFGDPNRNNTMACKDFWTKSESKQEPCHPKHDADEDWDTYTPLPKKPESTPIIQSKPYIPPGLPPRLQKQALENQRLQEMHCAKGAHWSRSSSGTEEESAKTKQPKNCHDFSSHTSARSQESFPNAIGNPQPQVEQETLLPLVDPESRAQFQKPQAKQAHFDELPQPSGSKFVPLELPNFPESRSQFQQPQEKEARKSEVRPPPGFTFQPAPPKLSPNFRPEGINSPWKNELKNQEVNLQIPEWPRVISHRSRTELTLEDVIENPKPYKRNDRADSPSDFIMAKYDTERAERDSKKELTHFLSAEQLANLSQALEKFPQVNDQVVTALIEVMFPDVVEKIRAHAQAKLRAQASQMFPLYAKDLVNMSDFNRSLATFQQSIQVPLSSSNDSFLSSLGCVQNCAVFPQFSQQYLQGANNVSIAPEASRFHRMLRSPVPNTNFEQERHLFEARLALSQQSLSNSGLNPESYASYGSPFLFTPE